MKGFSFGGLTRRRWTVVVALVVGLVVFSVTRLRGIFGSDNQVSRPAADSPENTGFQPKRLFEMFGSPGAADTVNFLDEHAHPQRFDDAPLPWSHTLTTDDPTLFADLPPNRRRSMTGLPPRRLTHGVE